MKVVELKWPTQVSVIQIVTKNVPFTYLSGKAPTNVHTSHRLANPLPPVLTAAEMTGVSTIYEVNLTRCFKIEELQKMLKNMHWDAATTQSTILDQAIDRHTRKTHERS